MKSILELIKKLPWWMWLAAAVAIFILWQSISGWAAGRKLYNMALDNLRHDQSRVVEVLEENNEMYLKELDRVTHELKQLKQQEAAVRAENQRLAGRIYELERDKVKTERIRNLEKEVDLGKREVELKDWIIEIKDMRIAAQDQAIKDLKDITDRALKLAEQGKPKTNWGLLGTVLLAVFTLGLVVGM